MDKTELLEKINILLYEYEDRNSGSIVGCHISFHDVKVTGVVRDSVMIDHQREYFEYNGEKFVSSKPICYLNEDF